MNLMYKTTVIFLIGTFFLSPLLLASNKKIHYNLDSLSAAEKKEALQIISEVESALPKKLKDVLSKLNLKVNFKNVNKSSEPKKLIKRYYNKLNRTISLEKNLLSYSNKNLNSSISQKNFFKYTRKVAKHTLAHEMFHAYDNSSFKPKVKYKGCEDFNSLDQKEINNLTNRCRLLYNNSQRKTRISSDKLFQRQAFWKKGSAHSATLNKYENTNIKEYAAVNFEYFLFDKDYQCHRPSQYNYFSREFNHKPFENSNCKGIDLLSLSILNNKKYLVQFDIDRVYQVQYLLASSGEGLISNFGHSMIRLVICAPEHVNPVTKKTIPATPMGPSCLKDIRYHLILSFRANVTDLNIGFIKGLVGGYRSILFVTPLEQIKLEYNRDEFRNLYNFPILFSKQQKQNFLKQTLYLHWGYKGDYKFITVNCATETLDMFASVIEDLAEHPMPAITPRGVLKSLQKAGLIDSKYNKKNKYEDLGRLNIMESDASYLIKALEVITEIPSKKKVKAQKKQILNYLEKQSAAERREILDSILDSYKENLSAKEDNDFLKRVTSFVVLERRAKYFFNKAHSKGLLAAFIKKIKNDKVDFNASDANKSEGNTNSNLIDDFLKYKEIGHQNFKSSYGTPLKSKKETILNKSKKYIEDESKYIAAYRKASSLFKDMEVNAQAELAIIDKNLEIANNLKKEIRAKLLIKKVDLLEANTEEKNRKLN